MKPRATDLFLTLLLILFSSSLWAAAGDLDTSFNASANDMINAIAQQVDGKIIICGDFTMVNGVARNRVARLNTDGSLDTSFNPGSGADMYVNTCVVQADGRILIGGQFTTVNGTDHNFIARLNADGSLDTGFNPSVVDEHYYEIGYLNAVVIQADGKIIIGGQFTTVNGVARNAIARLNADGSLDTSFIGGAYKIKTIAVQPDGFIVIGGDFYGPSRLWPFGGIDHSFNVDIGSIGISTIALQSDGKMIIGGGKLYFGGIWLNGIARLNTNGSFDNSFTPTDGSSRNMIFTISEQADSKILVGGLSSINNTDIEINSFVRLNADGSLDNSFNPGSGANKQVNSVVTQADGRILIAGGFTIYNGLAKNYIARIHSGDIDSDGIEDAADFDVDGDDINNSFDNCPVVENLDQLDNDEDGHGDVCDVFPSDPSEWKDTDGDRVGNNSDNCPNASNVPQTDTDSDAQGDVCDADDDNDGMSDVWEITYGFNPLLNDANGDLDGDGISNLQEYLNGGNPATKPVKNDFAADGKADLLLRNNTTGDWSLTSLNGLTILNQSTVGAFSDIENKIVSTADFDGDGDADILTRGTDSGLLPGTFHIDLTDGATVTGSVWLNTMSTDLNDEVMSTKDFNKDGKADVLLRNSATGVWTLNLMNGVSDPDISTLNASTDLCYTMKGDGDYDGNGYPDILLRRDACGGTTYPWLINTTDGDNTILASGTATGVSMNTSWGALVTDKDFNGDGKSDLLIRALSGSVQQWLLYDMNGVDAPSASGLLNIPVQSMWQFASEADLNGDGNADILLRSTDTGQWYADLLDGRTIFIAGVVNIAMNPVWALQGIDDNNGDGRGDILLRNNASGQWYLNLMNGLTVQSNSVLPITTDLSYTLQND